METAPSGPTRQVDRFNIGDVLHTAFWIYARNFPAFYLLALIGHLPAYFATDYYAPATYAFVSSNWLGWLVDALVSSPWQSSALTYAAVRILRSGRPSGLSDVLRQAVLAFPRVLLVGILAGVLIFLGSLLLIVPGLILALMFAVAAPVAVVERRAASALRRSHELTQGHKGAILGLSLLMWLPILVAPLAIASVADMADLGPYLVGLLLPVLDGFYVVVIAVVYHDLRVLKEGPDRSIADIFD